MQASSRELHQTAKPEISSQQYHAKDSCRGGRFWHRCALQEGRFGPWVGMVFGYLGGGAAVDNAPRSHAEWEAQELFLSKQKTVPLVRKDDRYDYNSITSVDSSQNCNLWNSMQTTDAYSVQQESMNLNLWKWQARQVTRIVAVLMPLPLFQQW